MSSSVHEEQQSEAVSGTIKHTQRINSSKAAPQEKKESQREVLCALAENVIHENPA
jgi:hypothetical protein